MTNTRRGSTDLRKDINELSNRVTRIETILKQQRQGTTVPDTLMLCEFWRCPLHEITPHPGNLTRSGAL